MKTKIYIPVVLTSFVILFTISLAAKNFTFEDEGLVKDIPFDTEQICRQLNLENQLCQFQFDDEELVNDVPFNTEEVVESYLYTSAIQQTFTFEDEELIDDIPFEIFNFANQSNENKLQSCYHISPPLVRY